MAKSCCFLFRRFLPEQLLILFQLQNWISLKPVSVTIFRTSLKWFFPSDICRHQNERYRFGWLKRYVCSKQLQVGKNERKEKTQRQLFKHWDISSFVFSFFPVILYIAQLFFLAKKRFSLSSCYIFGCLNSQRLRGKQNWLSVTMLLLSNAANICQHQNGRYRSGWLKRYVCSKQLQVEKMKGKKKRRGNSSNK